ncbi:DUF4127 family protein [Allofournierella massiliensis]|mgnify:FL=1|uniref:Uncharacterized protein DUF4127 n=1 Tax=Allofournierella massiliensis TaxID=1650663 RepID=A0A4R1R7D3_9FIRM|nr:DUF4127 family protein [Fournierella massiliensis]TCL61399.1 uncharacterized protein DUF4127 [Fournierella massiliensis]
MLNRKLKLVLLPLDERPCNRLFPQHLFQHDGVELVVPETLGDKKQPADLEKVDQFLLNACRDADGLVLSLDTLLYGGLVPSRIHHKTPEELEPRMDIIRRLKQENPRLLIYGFQVVMRCPDYSSDDEEPDYYEQYGEQIHRAGEVLHRSRLGLCGDQELKVMLEEIDQDKLKDYVDRRSCNLQQNYRALELVEQGVLDALVIPQDDSAAYGYAAMDQQSVRDRIARKGLMRDVLMYPGADEVGLTLLARMLNHMAGRKPKVYVKYAAEGAKSVLPIYEGCSLDTTIRNQLLSAGCQITDSYENADIILAVTAPAERIEEAVQQPSQARGYCVERSLPELVDFVEERVREGRIVTIADNAYGNGGEMLLIRMLNRAHLLDKVAGYAGWNTSANTLGTAIAEGVDAYHFGITQSHQNFLVERYIEDAGYCGMVRARITRILSQYGMNYFDVREQDGVVSAKVRQELERFTREELSSIAPRVELHQVWMPWRRMFEIGLDASIRPQLLAWEA